MTNNMVFAVLALLDDMANRECDMGWNDVEDLCKARELLSEASHAIYNEDTGRYEVPHV